MGTPTVVMYREDLARLLGITLDRLHFDIRQTGRLVMFEIFVDGKDLTPEQEQIAADFIMAHDGMVSVFVANKA